MNRLFYFTIILMLVPVIFAFGHAAPHGHHEPLSDERHDATHNHQKYADQAHLDTVNSGNGGSHRHTIDSHGNITHNHGRSVIATKITPPEYVHAHVRNGKTRYHAHTKAHDGRPGIWATSHIGSTWYDHSPLIDWDNEPDNSSIWDAVFKPADDEPINHSHHLPVANGTIWRSHTHTIPPPTSRYFHFGSEWTEHSPTIDWGVGNPHLTTFNQQNNNQDDNTGGNPTQQTRGNPHNPTINWSNQGGKDDNTDGNPTQQTDGGNQSSTESTQATRGNTPPTYQPRNTGGGHQPATETEPQQGIIFSVVASEIMYLDWTRRGGGNNPQYLELFNSGSDTNLQGWSITIDGIADSIVINKSIPFYRGSTILLVTSKASYFGTNLMYGTTVVNLQLHRVNYKKKRNNFFKYEWQLYNTEGTLVFQSGWDFGKHVDGLRKSINLIPHPDQPELGDEDHYYYGSQWDIGSPSNPPPIRLQRLAPMNPYLYRKPMATTWGELKKE